MTKEKTVKPLKVKIPPVFRKRYTEAQYKKKILGKLFIAADKAFVESLYATEMDPKKGGTRYVLDASLIKDKKTMKRVAAIGKEIKKQKGRINLGNVIAALACCLVLVLTLVVFRNQIARAVIVSSMQGAFGAKCEVRSLDVNLLDTHFGIEGLAQASREDPMKNLFEAGKIDVKFDLLELSRGKLVAENVEITGVTWGTARATSGKLPPRAEKKFAERQKNAKPNPVQEKLSAEFNRLKSGISVGSGISAVKDQLDPAKYIEQEKASLLSPAVVAEVQAIVPALTDKWSARADDARKKADAAMADAKAVSAIKPQTMKTAAEVKSALDTVTKAADTSKDALAFAQTASKEIGTDTATVRDLSAKAEKAIAADSARLKGLAASVKSINLQTGSRAVSGLFDSFIAGTLGTYYPYYQKGMSALAMMQSSSKDKKEKGESLKDKANALSRLPGRDLSFGSGSMPSFAMRRVKLSAGDASGTMSGNADAENVTNDQERLGAPTTFAAAFAHGAMSERVSGKLDFRAAATERVNAGFDVGGYPVTIPSAGSGIPGVSGKLGSVGTLIVSPDGTLVIETTVRVKEANLTVPAFDPEFLHSMYADVLSGIKTVDLGVRATISPAGEVSVQVSSGIDKVVNEALQAGIARQVERVKAEVKKYAENWIADQKKAYSSEIAQFTDISSKVTDALTDAKSGGKAIDGKKAELEARGREIAADAVKQGLDKAPVPDAVKGTLEKLW